MVEQARRKLPAQVTVLAGDGERLPFPDGSFDLMTCCDSFHHYPDPRRAAEEFCRVLRPGGQVILCEYWQPGPVRWLMNALLPYSSEGDVRIYSRRELAALDAGVDRIDSSLAGIGGCTVFKNASGNIATEDTVYMLNGMGIETGIDLEKAIKAGEFVESLVDPSKTDSYIQRLEKIKRQGNGIE